jgi:hypothetical protein
MFDVSMEGIIPIPPMLVSLLCPIRTTVGELRLPWTGLIRLPSRECYQATRSTYMLIRIQQQRTDRFLSETGAWTARSEDALHFDNLMHAFAYCASRTITDAEIKVQKDDGTEIRFSTGSA